jgi:hypothetical protein
MEEQETFHQRQKKETSQGEFHGALRAGPTRVRVAVPDWHPPLGGIRRWNNLPANSPQHSSGGSL